MYAFIVRDDRGAITIEWVTLSAGLIVFGIVVAYSVLGDAHSFLLEGFDQLNEQIEDGNADLSAAAQEIDINP